MNKPYDFDEVQKLAIQGFPDPQIVALALDDYLGDLKRMCKEPELKRVRKARRRRMRKFKIDLAAYHLSL